jgi:ferredoxin like protein
MSAVESLRRVQVRARSLTAKAAGHDASVTTRPVAGVTGSSADEQWAPVSFEDRIAASEFRISERAHITIDESVCSDCSTRECVIACPANLFVPTASGSILFNYENCFECGTCYLVCNKGSVSWSYPTGGYGVVFRRT